MLHENRRSKKRGIKDIRKIQIMTTTAHKLVSAYLQIIRRLIREKITKGK
jgi:hypothetical protein